MVGHKKTKDKKIWFLIRRFLYDSIAALFEFCSFYSLFYALQSDFGVFSRWSRRVMGASIMTSTERRYGKHLSIIAGLEPWTSRSVRPPSPFDQGANLLKTLYIFHVRVSYISEFNGAPLYHLYLLIQLPIKRKGLEYSDGIRSDRNRSIWSYHN